MDLKKGDRVVVHPLAFKRSAQTWHREARGRGTVLSIYIQPRHVSKPDQVEVLVDMETKPRWLTGGVVRPLDIIEMLGELT